MILRRPTPALSRFISHYWLARDNMDAEHPVLPDGSVDVVFEVGHRAISRAYGPATRASACPVSPGFHYLGVCFRPGQARHFLMTPAGHLANTNVLVPGLAAITAESIADDIASGNVFDRLQSTLVAWLAQHPVSLAAVDIALDAIERTNGRMRIDRLAQELGISRRNLERWFLDSVGISPKSYARIRRWQHAFAMVRARRNASLADIAIGAGYADQSHMNRDFRDLIGRSPRVVADVAFVQDSPLPPHYPAPAKTLRDRMSGAV